jgi:hypothetical protein
LLRAMVGLVDEMRADGVKVLLYLTPVDLERGASGFGPKLTADIERNRETVKRALATEIEADEELRLVDFAGSAPTVDFLDHGGAPNEHLTTVGRQRLMEVLKPEIDALLSGKE